MNINDYKGIFVFIQQSDGAICKVSFELLGKAKELSDDINEPVTAVIAGCDVADTARELVGFVDRMIIIDDPLLKEYRAEPYAQALKAVIDEYKPSIFLIGATCEGKELGPKVAARVGTGITADCTELKIGCKEAEAEGKEADGTKELLMIKPAFDGNTIVTITITDRRPRMATVREGVFDIPEPEEKRACDIVEFAPSIEVNDSFIEILKDIKEKAGASDIANAKVVVAGGRGMGNADNFSLLEELAGVLGGAVGCSRAAADEEMYDRECYIGQTGLNVRPDIFIACGISGAVQFTAGMEKSKLIIAINKDPDAPIFRIADYGIVADAATMIPQITKKFKEM